MYDARKLALERMQREAKLLGADGIIGVDLDIKELHNVLGTKGEYMEVVAVGTAVKLTNPALASSYGRAQVTVSTR